MIRLFFATAALGAMFLGPVSQAQAGCVSGAIVGGLAGHLLGHHGGIGAAAGCAYGVSRNHHRYYRSNDDRRGYGDGQDYRRATY
jgi:uncharacterized protein YcfJ